MYKENFNALLGVDDVPGDYELCFLWRWWSENSFMYNLERERIMEKF